RRAPPPPCACGMAPLRRTATPFPYTTLFRSHVLPAPLVAAARHVAVRQFVDQRHPRLAREQGIEVELVQRATLVLDASTRQDLEIGRAHVELQSRENLVCRPLLEKKQPPFPR